MLSDCNYHCKVCGLDFQDLESIRNHVVDKFG